MFGRKARIRKAVDRAIARLERADDLADHSEIEALPEDHRAQAYGRLATALFQGEWYLAARHSVASALALAPGAVELHQLAASIAIEIGDRDEAIAAQRRVVAMQPGNAPSAAALAEMLIDEDRAPEAIELLRPLRDLRDPLIETRLAEALFVTGEAAEALAILDGVCDHYDGRTKELAGAEWEALTERAAEASRLRDDVYAELHGREATIELAARAGKLDGGGRRQLQAARRAARGDGRADRGRARARDARGDPAARARAARRRSRQRARPRARRLRRAAERRGRGRARDVRARVRVRRALFRRVRRAGRRDGPRDAGAASPRGATRAAEGAAGRTREGRARLAGADRRRTPRGVAVGAAVRAPARRPRRARRRDQDPADRRARDRRAAVRERRGRARRRSPQLRRDFRRRDPWRRDREDRGVARRRRGRLDVRTRARAPRVLSPRRGRGRAPPAPVRARDRARLREHRVRAADPDEFFAVSYADYLRHRHELPGVPLDDDAGIQHGLRVYFDQLATA